MSKEYISYKGGRRALIFRTATVQDDAQLLALLEADDFKGGVSLLYTRRPSPTASLARDGKRVIVVVGETTDTHRIVMFFTFVFNTLYMNGVPADAGYIGSFRVHKGYLSYLVCLRTAFPRLLEQYKDTQYFYCSILESNLLARRLLEKKRKGMQRLVFLGYNLVYALKTGGRKKLPAGFSFRQCTQEDIPALLAFLAKAGQHRSFFPVLSAQALEEGQSNPHYSDFYLLCGKDGAVCAAGAVWNQQAYKQYIMQGVHGIYKLIFFFLDFLTLFGYPVIEKQQTVMNFFTLSFFAATEPAAFKLFITQLKQQTRSYAYFIIGMFRDDPLKKVVCMLPHFLYKSRIYQWEGHALPAGNTHIPYFECGRL